MKWLKKLYCACAFSLLPITSFWGTTLGRSAPGDQDEHILFAQTTNQKEAKIKLALKASSTIAEVKEAIQQRRKQPVKQIFLVFAGQKLEEKNTLAHYHIDSGQTVHVIDVIERKRHTARNGMIAIAALVFIGTGSYCTYLYAAAKRKKGREAKQKEARKERKEQGAN